MTSKKELRARYHEILDKHAQLEYEARMAAADRAALIGETTRLRAFNERLLKQVGAQRTLIDQLRRNASTEVLGLVNALNEVRATFLVEPPDETPDAD